MNKVFYLNKLEDNFFKQLIGRTVVVTNGCFDILHLGHAQYLELSKQHGDLLIVGVNSDRSVKELKGSSRPINNELDRATLLTYLRAVDFVIIFDEINACNLLSTVKPNVYTKGNDYSKEQTQQWPEYKTAQQLGCKIVLVDFLEGKSSSRIIEKINFVG